MTQNTAVSKRLILHSEIVSEETETMNRLPMKFLRGQKALLCTFCYVDLSSDIYEHHNILSRNYL